MRIDFSTWEKDMVPYLQKITEFLQDIDKNKLILLIPCRGGEYIGSAVKNHLGLFESQVRRIKFTNTLYEGKKGVIIKREEESKIWQELISEVNDEQKILLVVDDILDTGETLDYISRAIAIKRRIIAPLYLRENSPKKELANIYEREIPKGWIEFPWENFYKK